MTKQATVRGPNQLESQMKGGEPSVQLEESHRLQSTTKHESTICTLSNMSIHLVQGK